MAFITQIEGWNFFVKGWFPDIPLVNRAEFNSTTNKTTWSIFRQNVLFDLFYVDSYTHDYNEVNALNSTVLIEGKSRDATHQFKILFAYNTVSDTVIMREGTPSASPVTPSLLPNEVLITVKTEPEIGGAVVDEPTLSLDDYFKIKFIDSNSGAIELDFNYAKNILNLTENITSVTYTGNPQGKVLVLQHVGNASYTITFPSNFKPNDYAIIIPANILKTIQYIIQQDDSIPNNGKFFYDTASYPTP